MCVTGESKVEYSILFILGTFMQSYYVIVCAFVVSLTVCVVVILIQYRICVRGHVCVTRESKVEYPCRRYFALHLIFLFIGYRNIFVLHYCS